MAEKPRQGKVTVVGAGFYGSTTAQRLAEYDIFDDGRPHRHRRGQAGRPGSRPEPVPTGRGLRDEGHRGHDGKDGSGYEAIAGSSVVVITAGLPRKPGMSRMDLIETNAGIVRQVAENVARHAPDAVVVVVSNPLDEMTALAQIATGFPKNRVLGQAGMLDTARFTFFVAEELGVPVAA